MCGEKHEMDVRTEWRDRAEHAGRLARHEGLGICTIRVMRAWCMSMLMKE